MLSHATNVQWSIPMQNAISIILVTRSNVNRRTTLAWRLFSNQVERKERLGNNSSVARLAILDEIIITKYCTKRKACERQRAYTHSLTPCLPNDEGRSWGCVSCCGDRDLCNYNHSNRLHSSINSRRWLLLYVVFVLVITNRWQLPVLSPRV